MKESKSNIWLKTLFIIYVILLIWIIIFRLNFSVSSIHRIRELNLIPFYYENVYEGDIPIFEEIINVLLFLPFGIYLKMFGITNKKIILSGFVISCLFELCQFIFKFGASDITDIITNTLGTICGIYLYSLFCKIFKDNNKVNKIFKIIATIMSTIMMALFFLLLINFII